MCVSTQKDLPRNMQAQLWVPRDSGGSLGVNLCGKSQGAGNSGREHEQRPWWNWDLLHWRSLCEWRVRTVQQEESWRCATLRFFKWWVTSEQHNACSYKSTQRILSASPFLWDWSIWKLDFLFCGVCALWDTAGTDQKPLLSVLGTVCIGLAVILHTGLQFFLKTPSCFVSYRILLTHSFLYSHEVPNYSYSMSMIAVYLNFTFPTDSYRHSR